MAIKQTGRAVPAHDFVDRVTRHPVILCEPLLHVLGSSSIQK